MQKKCRFDETRRERSSVISVNSKAITAVMNKLVCQTQIINGVDRLDPADHKYLKVKRVKLNEKQKRILKLSRTAFNVLLISLTISFFHYQSC